MVRCLSHVGPRRRRQHGFQFDQRLTVHEWRGCQMQVITGGRFKHPCRHFHRSVIALILNAAPTDRMSAFGYRFVHCDKPTEPRMPQVPDFSRLSIVGVALSSCTTSGAGIRPSAT